MKKIFLSLSVIIGMSFVLNAHATEAEMKPLVEKLCTALVKSDRDTFVSMVDESSQSSIRWWWDSSGKGKYFSTLYGSCKFDHIDQKNSKAGSQYKVFVQRYNKDGSKWSRPAPVVFKKNSKGEWKIVNYSI